jgi:hypothetical protein
MKDQLIYLALAIFMIAVFADCAGKGSARTDGRPTGDQMPLSAQTVVAGPTSKVAVPVKSIRKVSGLSISGYQPGMHTSQFSEPEMSKFHRNGTRLESSGVALDLDPEGDILAVNGASGSTVEEDGVKLFGFSDGYDKARKVLKTDSKISLLEDTIMAVEATRGKFSLRVVHFYRTGPEGNKGNIGTIRLTYK